MMEFLPVLLALACPVGMAAMMTGPLLIRRLGRRHAAATDGSH